MRYDVHRMDIVVFNHLNPDRSRAPVHGLFERAAVAARDEGLRVVDMPWRDLDIAAADALALVPAYESAVGIYNGPVVDLAWYADLEKAAHALGICMVNTADANNEAMQFERFYPLLADLTARSWVIESVDQLNDFDLVYPLFVKGMVASDKHRGLDACLAHGDEQIIERLDRGPVIAREFMDLRLLGGDHNGMPITREYRVYTVDDLIVNRAFYWDHEDPSGALSEDERASVDSLVGEACSRLSARMLSIDVGQLVDGSWRIIETGDPQHTGIGSMPAHRWWRQLQQIL